MIPTYDENGGYPHPDHVMTHKVSMAAFDAAADPDAYPDAGEPWQPLKLYYFVCFHRARTALHEAMLRRGLESPYTESSRSGTTRAAKRAQEGRATGQSRRSPPGSRAATTRIRDQALLAHATQIDPDGSWFRMPARGPAGGLADRGLSSG